MTTRKPLTRSTRPQRTRSTTAAAPLRAKVPGATRQRLIQASIELFNRYGVPNVSLTQIAAAVGISQGNLTYHFKRRDDLVYATFEVLEQRMSAVLFREITVAPPDLQNAEDAADVLLRIVRTFWEFRFLFNSLTFLLAEDTRLREAYFAFQERAQAGIAETNHIVMRSGVLLPMQKHNTLRLLADNVWTQWLGWLRMQQIHNPEAVLPDGDALYDCVLHHWSLMRPYLQDDFAEQLVAQYRKLLKPGEARSPTAVARAPSSRRKP